MNLPNKLYELVLSLVSRSKSLKDKKVKFLLLILNQIRNHFVHHNWSVGYFVAQCPELTRLYGSVWKLMAGHREVRMCLQTGGNHVGPGQALTARQQLRCCSSCQLLVMPR